MKRRYPKPVICLSKCLGSARCRWNGERIRDEFVEELSKKVEFVTVCPEVEIGLGVPRDPVRVIYQAGSYRLIQVNTGRDVTDVMNAFTAGYLDSIGGVSGFILKARSPSCGIKDSNVYPDLESPDPIDKTSGFFAAAVLKKFPGVAIGTESTLSDPETRRRFIDKVFGICIARKM